MNATTRTPSSYAQYAWDLANQAHHDPIFGRMLLDQAQHVLELELRSQKETLFQRGDEQNANLDRLLASHQ